MMQSTILFWLYYLYMHVHSKHNTCVDSYHKIKLVADALILQACFPVPKMLLLCAILIIELWMSRSVFLPWGKVKSALFVDKIGSSFRTLASKDSHFCYSWSSSHVLKKRWRQSEKNVTDWNRGHFLFHSEALLFWPLTQLVFFFQVMCACPFIIHIEALKTFPSFFFWDWEEKCG